MQDNLIDEKVRLLIVNYLNLDFTDQISRDQRFVEDLGMDSIQLLELILEVEQEFEIEIPDEDSEKLCTVGELIDYVAAHTN